MTWPIVRLEELAAPEPNAIKIGPFGSQLKREELVDEGVHVVGIENVLAGTFDGLGRRFVTSEKYRALRSVEVTPGDVVVTMMGTVGEVAVVPPGTSPSIMDSHLLRFRPNLRLCLPEFVAWFLRSPNARTAVNNRAHGAIMKGLNSAIVRSLPIPRPSLSEQRHIVEILDRADRLRRLRKEADAEGDHILRVLFLRMFGDPMRNPHGLPARTIGDCLDLQNGRAFHSSEWVSSGTPIIRIQNLKDPEAPFNYYDGPDLPLKFRVKTGDLLFSWSGTPGTSFGAFLWDGPEGWLNQHIFNIRPIVPLDYVYLKAHLDAQLPAIIGAAHGGVGLRHVTKDELTRLPLLLAPAGDVAIFVRRAKMVLAAISQARHASGILETLWARLVDDAFSGTLTASWRQAHARELLEEVKQRTTPVASAPSMDSDAY